jgi:PAS domain S-box-containing protein
MVRSLKPLVDKIVPPERLKAPQSYALSVLLVLAAALVRWWLPGVLRSFPFLAFYPVLVFAAALGGFGPGLLATVLSWLCVTYFFDSTPGFFGLTDPSELGRLIVFSIGGLGVSVISEAQLRGRERQARQSRELKELTQLTNLGPFIIRDEQDQIIQWSEGCVRLYGYNAEDAIGRVSHDLLQTVFPKPLEEINAILHQSGRWEGELQHTRADGSKLIVSSQWVLQDSSVGQKVLEICTDITRLKDIEESLRRTTEELKRSNQDLESFAYISSHDLQEPLRGIHGFLTLLQQRYAGQLDSKAKGYIGYAADGATRMSHLISDLLQYSRVGRGERQFQPIESSQILAGALANLRSAVEEAGAEVTCDSLPVVMGDPNLLSRLFQNLIGNAVKFRSPDRPCKIHIGCKRNGTFCQFSVTDNGIGIESEYYGRIFVIFQRLHTRQKYEGTGIGLAICKRIVERHGGRIWVESKPGEGSTFLFELSPASEVGAVPWANRSTLTEVK